MVLPGSCVVSKPVRLGTTFYPCRGFPSHPKLHALCCCLNPLIVSPCSPYILGHPSPQNDCTRRQAYPKGTSASGGPDRPHRNHRNHRDHREGDNEVTTRPDSDTCPPEGRLRAALQGKTPGPCGAEGLFRDHQIIRSISAAYPVNISTRCPEPLIGQRRQDAGRHPA